MPKGRIEHVNLTVTDIERSAVFFEKLLGWRQRWRGAAMNGGETGRGGELGMSRRGRPRSSSSAGPISWSAILRSEKPSAARCSTHSRMCGISKWAESASRLSHISVTRNRPGSATSSA